MTLAFVLTKRGLSGVVVAPLRAMFYHVLKMCQSFRVEFIDACSFVSFFFTCAHGRKPAGLRIAALRSRASHKSSRDSKRPVSPTRPLLSTNLLFCLYLAKAVQIILCTDAQRPQIALNLKHRQVLFGSNNDRTEQIRSSPNPVIAFFTNQTAANFCKELLKFLEVYGP